MSNLIVRSLPISRDSRTGRYSFIFKNTEFFTWEDHDSEQKHLLKRGRLDYHLAISYFIFLTSLFLYVLLNRNKFTKIICMDLDTYLPVLLANKLSFSKSIVFFDIVDPISQTRFRNLFFNHFFDHVEVFLIRKLPSRIIVPNIFRLDYYQESVGVKFKIKIIELVNVIENVPQTSRSLDDLNMVSTLSDIGHKNKIKIGYFGSLDSTRGITELIEYFGSMSDYELVFAGRGELSPYIENIALSNCNVNFLGVYTSVDLKELYSMVDFVWAYYDPKILLHKYASPNKYYEHLAFKTPIIFNKIVPQSLQVVNKGTGCIIDDNLSSSSFSILCQSLNAFIYSKADFTDWEVIYSNYYENIKI